MAHWAEIQGDNGKKIYYGRGDLQGKMSGGCCRFQNESFQEAMSVHNVYPKTTTTTNRRGLGPMLHSHLMYQAGVFRLCQFSSLNSNQCLYV